MSYSTTPINSRVVELSNFAKVKYKIELDVMVDSSAALALSQQEAVTEFAGYINTKLIKKFGDPYASTIRKLKMKLGVLSPYIHAKMGCPPWQALQTP